MRRILLCCLFLLTTAAVSAQTAEQAQIADKQAADLMSKITVELTANRPRAAIPLFMEVETLGPKLSTPLAEQFYFQYIETLAKADDRVAALQRAEKFLAQHPKSGSYYEKVNKIAADIRFYQKISVWFQSAIPEERARSERLAQYEKLYREQDEQKANCMARLDRDGYFLAKSENGEGWDVLRKKYGKSGSFREYCEAVFPYPVKP